MGKWIVALGVVCALVSTQVEARRSRGPQGNSALHGEVLFLRPSICDLNYVLSDSRDSEQILADYIPLGRETGVDPDHDFGYRLWIDYLLPGGCQGGTSSYSYLSTSDRSRVVADGEGAIWPLLDRPNSESRMLPLFNNAPDKATADAQAIFRYYSTDFLYFVRIAPVQCVTATLFGGVHWARIEHELRVNYSGLLEFDFVQDDTNREADINRKKRVWGSGPELGVDLRYQLANGLEANLSVAGAVLVGERTSSIQEDSREATLDIPDVVTPASANLCFHTSRSIIPAVFVKAGIVIRYPLGRCISLITETGYQFTTYFSALKEIGFYGPNGRQGWGCDMVTFDGYYLGTGIQF